MKFAEPKANNRTKRKQNTEIIECPLCKNNVLVYCWSWHSGKKCPHCTVVFRPQNIYDIWKYPELNYISIQEYYKMSGKKLPSIEGIEN